MFTSYNDVVIILIAFLHREYQMKAIPETRRAHEIWYLRFNL
jgi:hypothetical protein